MRLEYTESQERELRITELNAVLENELYESNVEKYCLEIELQFLEGSKNVFGDPAAFIDADKIWGISLLGAEYDETAFRS